MHGDSQGARDNWFRERAFCENPRELAAGCRPRAVSCSKINHCEAARIVASAVERRSGATKSKVPRTKVAQMTFAARLLRLIARGVKPGNPTRRVGPKECLQMGHLLTQCAFLRICIRLSVFRCPCRVTSRRVDIARSRAAPPQGLAPDRPGSQGPRELPGVVRTRVHRRRYEAIAQAAPAHDSSASVVHIRHADARCLLSGTAPNAPPGENPRRARASRP
jgi:hypothetical protein